MKANPQPIQERLEHFRKVFKRAGIKMTVQRMELFRELASTGNHPDAQAILEAVRRKIPMVSLDTVYRALWLFIDLGLKFAGLSKLTGKTDSLAYGCRHADNKGGNLHKRRGRPCAENKLSGGNHHH